MSELTALARRLEEAQAQVDTARAELHTGIVRAKNSGQSVAAIARDAGLSRQAVYNIIREDESWRPVAEARMLDIERRYEKLVDTIARSIADPGDSKFLTMKKNQERAKLARKIGATEARRYVPTVIDEIRRAAEAQLLRLFEDRADDPEIQAIVRELDEAEALRTRLYGVKEIPF